MLARQEKQSSGISAAIVPRSIIAASAPGAAPAANPECCSRSENGGLAGTRTLDQCLKRALLYQLSYQPTQERGMPPGAGTPGRLKRAAKANQPSPAAQAYYWPL